MAATYPSISAGSATVTRSGGTVTIKVPFTAYNGNSSGVAARYLRIRTGGVNTTSGANASSVSATNTSSRTAYGAGSTTISADLYIQVQGNASFTHQASASRTVSWTAAQFTLDFDASPGTTPTASKTVTYGEKYGELPNPTRSGYAFLGWFTEDDAQITADDTVDITEDITIYAKWEPMSIIRKVENGEVTTFTKIYAVKGGTVKQVLGIYTVKNGTVKQCV